MAVSYITSVGVQHVQITISAGNSSATATISAVGSRAFISFQGWSSTVTSVPANSLTRVTLTNSTTITATRVGTTGRSIVNCTIVDATSDLVTSVQYGTVTLVATNTSNVAAISAVNPNTGTLHFLGVSSADVTIVPATQIPRLSYAGTTVTATVSVAVTSTMVVSFCMIEFNPLALQSNVQVFSISWSNAAVSTTQAIASVVSANTLLFRGGNSTTNLTLYTTSLQRASLTNNTTITVTVNSAGADTNVYNVTVVEFIAAVFTQPVQRGTTTLTAVSTASTVVNSTVLARTSGLFLGSSNTGTTEARSRARVNLGSTTSITTNRDSSTGNLTSSWSLAEWSFSDEPTPPTPQLPGCNDSPLELLRKILLQVISQATNPPDSVQPSCSDSSRDIYRKILLTLPFI